MGVLDGLLRALFEVYPALNDLNEFLAFSADDCQLVLMAGLRHENDCLH